MTPVSRLCFATNRCRSAPQPNSRTPTPTTHRLTAAAQVELLYSADIAQLQALTVTHQFEYLSISRVAPAYITRKTMDFAVKWELFGCAFFTGLASRIERKKGVDHIYEFFRRGLLDITSFPPMLYVYYPSLLDFAKRFRVHVSGVKRRIGQERVPPRNMKELEWMQDVLGCALSQLYLVDEVLPSDVTLSPWHCDGLRREHRSLSLCRHLAERGIQTTRRYSDMHSLQYDPAMDFSMGAVFDRHDLAMRAIRQKAVDIRKELRYITLLAYLPRATTGGYRRVPKRARASKVDLQRRLLQRVPKDALRTILGFL